MRKREDFAVSLRRKKKEQIINDKRKRLMFSVSHKWPETAPGTLSLEPSYESDDQLLYVDTNRLYSKCPIFVEEIPSNRRRENDGVTFYSIDEILQRILPQMPRES